MPAVKIKFDAIVFDPKVQTYCNNPGFKCPNYGHSWTCPPEAPYLEEEVSKYNQFFLIYYDFDLKRYVDNALQKNPKKTREEVLSKFYLLDLVRDSLELELQNYLDKIMIPYNELMVLWDGYCRICSKKGEKCTYDKKEQCRYPNEKRFSMEAVGIDVDKTVRSVGLELEWPPINHAYRFGLICLK